MTQRRFQVAEHEASDLYARSICSGLMYLGGSWRSGVKINRLITTSSSVFINTVLANACKGGCITRFCCH